MYSTIFIPRNCHGLKLAKIIIRTAFNHGRPGGGKMLPYFGYI